jgi:hypothetical protein
MYVTESLPAKIGGSRPTGLGVVVVSAVTVQLNEKKGCCGANKALTTTSPKPAGLDPSNFCRWTLCNMCKAKVINEKNIGFKKKVRVVSASRFFFNQIFF